VQIIENASEPGCPKLTCARLRVSRPNARIDSPGTGIWGTKNLGRRFSARRSLACVAIDIEAQSRRRHPEKIVVLPAHSASVRRYDVAMLEPLREISRVRQHTDSALHRRWFTCAQADLYVFDADGDLRAFELCYGKPHNEKSLFWSVERGFRHGRIDSGENTPFETSSPISTAEGGEDREQIALELERLGAAVDPPTYRTLLRVLHLGR
jgi:hypothetical protein